MALLRAALCAAVLGAVAPGALAQGSLLPLPEEKPIRGVMYPAVSPDGKLICFTYLGDLWTVPASGGVAARLTIHEALDGYPHWSPDGHWIAFTSDREGNYDIYLVPAEGGEARRMTYHTAPDFATDWSPDGTKILFTSIRDENTLQQYSLDIKTGVVRTLTQDDLYTRYGVYSPDGNTITYDRSGSIAVWWRPRYKGSAHSSIYSKSLVTGKVTRVTDYDGTDLWPMYSADGKSLYYVSDKVTPGNPNIVVGPATGGSAKAITNLKGDAVRYPSIARNGSLIAFTYNGALWTVRPSGGQATELNVYARSDDKENNVVRLNLTNSATEAEISPDGKTIALVVRGEIWTIPSDKGGDATRLTNNPANDWDVVWSPDSTKLAFSSDRAGNFNIYTIDVKTREVKPLSQDKNDENSPHWSPDGKSVAFERSGLQGGIYIAGADGAGQPRRVAASEGNNIFGVGITSYSWSPDSKWLAFSRRDTTNTQDVWVVPAAGGKETNVTYYPGTNVDPAWSSDGKYLIFASDRDREQGGELYSLPLQREKAEPEPKPAETKKPDAPKPDAPKPDGPKPPDAKPADAKPADAKPADAKKGVEVKIDFEDIEDRAKRITTQGAGPFAITPDGKSVIFVSSASGGSEYWSVPVNGGSVQRLTGSGEGTSEPRFASDSNVFYAVGAGGTVKSITRAPGMWAANNIAFSARMDLDRRAEKAQAFNEFWRRVKVGFYDPNMHGVDWAAMRTKYEPYLSGVGTPIEFATVLSMMVGELNSSHSEVGPAPRPSGGSTATLGIKFDETYLGPGLKVVSYMPKGPDDDLGPKVKPGEYIMQIDGQDVSWNEKTWDVLLDRAGKDVELLVNSKPTKDGARTLKVKPITDEQWRDLEYDRKVKANRALVDKLSGGRLAYIHIRGMDQPSLKKLERELWGRAREKDGLVLDVRDNGGGNTHDEILSQLSRVPYAYTQPRDASRSTQPFRHWDKPIILLINQNSASDAEIFPNGFRALKLGKVLGVPTPGYVIGTYNGRLQDGTSYRVPMWGYFTLDGKDMENVGVKPDITVEETPEDITAQRDRQIEVAVDNLLKEVGSKN